MKYVLSVPASKSHPSRLIHLETHGEKATSVKGGGEESSWLEGKHLTRILLWAKDNKVAVSVFDEKDQPHPLELSTRYLKARQKHASYV